MKPVAKVKHKARQRPAETTTLVAGLAGLLVALGLDRPVAAALAAVLAVIPSVVTWLRDRNRDRPAG